MVPMSEIHKTEGTQDYNHKVACKREEIYKQIEEATINHNFKEVKRLIDILDLEEYQYKHF